MKRLMLSITAVFASVASPTFATAMEGDLAIRFVVELHRNEPYEGHLFHRDRLWVGQSKQSDGDSHRVSIFDSEGKVKVAEVNLPHSVNQIVPYGDGVIVPGKKCCPWQTGFSVIREVSGRFNVQTTMVSEQYQIDKVAAGEEGIFFSDPGDRALLQQVGRSTRFVTQEVSGPGEMVLRAGKLWVVERKSPQFGDEDIARIDLSTGRVERVFNENRPGIASLIYVNAVDLMAVSEISGRVLFVDPETMRTVGEVAVEGAPRGMTTLGKCLLVASEDSKGVTFIDTKAADFPVISEWNLTAAGDRLKKPRSVAVDPKNGTVFLRSTYLCPSCTATQSSVVAITEPSSSTFAQCSANEN